MILAFGSLLSISICRQERLAIIMNAFWLKIAGIVIVILGVIVLINVFSSSKPEVEGEHKPKTYYEQIREDDERLRADPKPKQPPVGKQGPEAEEPVKPEFKELSQEDELQAQKLYEWALTQRKMGRLPGLGYKKMVDACREIIQKYPDSEYAFKAKRMLADIPVRYRPQYGITEEEIDLGDWK